MRTPDAIVHRAERDTVTVTPEPEGVTIRPAERADLLAVHRIEREAFPQPWPFDAFDRFLDAPAFLVAVDDETASGAGLAAGGTGGGNHGPDASTPQTHGDASGDSDGALDASNVVGFVVGDVTPNHGRTFGHVKDVAVHADYRQRGIATTLLERALVRLAGEGATSVKLEVRVGNEAARSLYRSFGFSPMRRRERYYDDGEDAIVLGREL